MRACHRIRSDVLAALIAMGWSFVKPALSTCENVVITIALTFQVSCLYGNYKSSALQLALLGQVLANIAVAVVGEMAPGSIAFEQWSLLMSTTGEFRNSLRLSSRRSTEAVPANSADVASFLVVLFPAIFLLERQIGSIRSSQSEDADSVFKLMRLKELRVFSISSIVFFVVSRIVLAFVATVSSCINGFYALAPAWLRSDASIAIQSCRPCL